MNIGGASTKPAAVQDLPDLTEWHKAADNTLFRSKSTGRLGGIAAYFSFNNNKTSVANAWNKVKADIQEAYPYIKDAGEHIDMILSPGDHLTQLPTGSQLKNIKAHFDAIKCAKFIGDVEALAKDKDFNVPEGDGNLTPEVQAKVRELTNTNFGRSYEAYRGNKEHPNYKLATLSYSLQDQLSLLNKEMLSYETLRGQKEQPPSSSNDTTPSLADKKNATKSKMTCCIGGIKADLAGNERKSWYFKHAYDTYTSAVPDGNGKKVRQHIDNIKPIDIEFGNSRMKTAQEIPDAAPAVKK